MTRIVIFSLLLVLYVGYSLTIYSAGSNQSGEVHEALAGKMLWQKHNCQSCHQLYGLGGYLGPDLTNCYSTPHKGPAYIDAILQYGNGIMPDFKLTDVERTQLITFLKQVDASGTADPKRFTITPTGNIYPDASK